MIFDFKRLSLYIVFILTYIPTYSQKTIVDRYFDSKNNSITILSEEGTEYSDYEKATYYNSKTKKIEKIKILKYNKYENGYEYPAVIEILSLKTPFNIEIVNGDSIVLKNKNESTIFYTKQYRLSKEITSPIPVKFQSGFYGILNYKKGYINDIKYEDIIPSYYNYLKVKKDNNWGLIDKSGKIIVPIIYQKINDNSPKYIVAINKVNSSLYEHTLYNRTGKVIIPKFDYFKEVPFVYNTIYHYPFNIKRESYNNLDVKKSFTCIKNDSILYTKRHEGYFLSYFNQDGEAILGYGGEGGTFLYQIIDINLNVLFESSNQIISLGEKMYSLKNENGLYALIDNKGNKITTHRYIEIRNFNQNRAFAVTENSFRQFIDRQGKTKIQLGNSPNYSNYDFSDFVNNYSISNGAIIDTLGDFKTPPMNLLQNKSLRMETFHNNQINYIQVGKHGVININGQIIIQPTYNNISNFKDGYAIVKKGDYFGVINELGREIIKPIYDKILPLYVDEYKSLFFNDINIEQNYGFKSIFVGGIVKVQLENEVFFVDILGEKYKND